MGRFAFARKALTATAATVLTVAGFSGTASASNGLIYNNNLRQCISVPSQAGVGSPVIVGNCNTYEANWSWGSLGLVQNNKTGLCIELPNGGGYAFLQQCGGTYQYLDFAPSTGLIGVHSDNRRLLGVDSSWRVQSAGYGAPNQYWSW
jgi:hypothetical protein